MDYAQWATEQLRSLVEDERFDESLDQYRAQQDTDERRRTRIDLLMRSHIAARFGCAPLGAEGW